MTCALRSLRGCASEPSRFTSDAIRGGCWSRPLQRQEKGEVHFSRTHSEPPVLVLHVVGPGKGSCPCIILTQQLVPVRLYREQDSSERFPPIMTPSDVSIAVFKKSFRRRPIDLGVRERTASTLLPTVTGPQKLQRRRRRRRGRARDAWPSASSQSCSRRRSVLRSCGSLSSISLVGLPRVR